MTGARPNRTDPGGSRGLDDYFTPGLRQQHRRRDHGPPARRGARPCEHVAGVGVTERALKGLVLTRAEAVARDIEILNSELLGHVSSWVVGG
jgi:hypothetical protein